ncbi:hypothetical protein CYMTET_32520 [Cymbomonas tetramitiformis]|uniref:RNA-directed DNA polymerase n=1 Tax=Cymbomonas tetramitiformis TaxID=36881 RepID=A0AAE0FF57_9CHLO|nr:hypothetical protein CYMTET_32520 [Cymbomonas tetramitiformis]
MTPPTAHPCWETYCAEHGVPIDRGNVDGPPPRIRAHHAAPTVQPSDYKDLHLSAPGASEVYQSSLADQRRRLTSWSWRSPAGATSESVLLRQLRMTLKKKSPAEAHKMAERSRRHATRRPATTPFSRRQRKYELDELILARLRGRMGGTLGLAWAELSPREQRRAVEQEYGPKTNVPQEGRPWETTGLRRLRRRQASAAISIQQAYRLWRRRRAQRAQDTPFDSHALKTASTWTTAVQRVRQCGKAIVHAVFGRVRRAHPPPNPAPLKPDETVLAATLGSSPSDLTHSTDESEMEIHCSQYRLQQHREQSSGEDTPTRRSKPSRSGRKRTTLDQRMKAWRKNEAARLAAWEAARLAAWEGLSTTQQPAGEPEHLEEELSMTQQLAGGSGSIPPACNQRAASCPSPPEEELNMTQQLAGGPNSPRRHATRPAEHATGLSPHATRPDQHATRLVQHATSGFQHATSASQHATSPAEHATGSPEHAACLAEYATSRPTHATSGSQHATCPAEHATRSAEHATCLAEHATSSPEHAACLAEHATRPAEHATRLARHATRPAQHATSGSQHATCLVEHATSLAKHATCPAEHATRPAEHATRQPGHATGSAKHATCPAEQATRLAQHATRSAQHATGGFQPLESGSDSDSTHVSATDSGITHVSATDSDTTHISATDSDTTHVSATGSDTTHVSDTNSDTTHVSPTDSDTTHVSVSTNATTYVNATEHGSGEEHECNALVDEAATALSSHPIEDALKCKRVQLDGGVRWKANTRTGTLLAHTLSAVRDEEGPLLLVFYAYLRGHRVKVLVDSGASDNFISADCARTCDLTVRSGTPMKVTLADGSVKTAGEVAYTKFTAHTAAGVNYCEKRMALRVLPLGIQVDVVLGGKWLRSLSPVTLDYAGHGSVSFNTRANGGGQQRVTLAGCSPGVGQGKAQGAGLIDEVFLTAAQLKQHLIHAETRRLAGDEESQPQWLMMAARGNDHEAAFAATAAEIPPPHTPVEKEGPRQDTRDAPVSSTWKQRFDAFFEKYLDTLCAALPEASKLRRTEEDKARIDRKPDAEGGPPCRRPYKMTAEELRQLRERIEQLMKKGYIRPSSSPYAAPCLMVPKPGDPKTLRLVVDYRQLNQQTVRDRYPLPDIQLMFDEMQGAAFFSSFDAVDGFWQVPMAEEDVEKTAFTTQMGAYEWLVMPQGLQNSPSQYQRRMQRALGHLPFVRIFIDDVVVFSRTVEEHYDHVRQFLDTCREKGVYLKASKAQMLKESLRFLGHTLSAEGCQPQHDKVSSIKDWPKLETVTHVRQFLGLAGYYRRFVHRFSEIAQPLTSLTKTDVPWQWGELQQWAFDELKTALSSAPVLALPDMKAAADGSAPFLVQTDASGVALGGVLMQDTGDGMRVIAYDSRQFSAAEQNYHTGERELCALHHCTTVTWRHYLFSSDFRLQGDHRPLEWLMSPGRELSRRQARWYMDLVEVGVPRMEYVKGALLLVPDALSRRPDYVTKDPRDGLKEAGVVDK